MGGASSISESDSRSEGEAGGRDAPGASGVIVKVMVGLRGKAEWENVGAWFW